MDCETYDTRHYMDYNLIINYTLCIIVGGLESEKFVFFFFNKSEIFSVNHISYIILYFSTIAKSTLYNTPIPIELK